MLPLTRRVALLAAGALAAAPSVAAAVTQAPASLTLDEVYAPPAHIVTAGEPGSGVWWREVPAGDPVKLPAAASTKRLIYRSIAVDGTPNVNSATVYIPAGQAPAGGWKVAAWNHVTTGGADQCAPSRATPLLPGTQTPNPEYERLTRAENLIARLVRRGIVVVRPDYEGIGTPGPHPYLIGRSLARSTTDGVRATRELIGNASTEWAVAGQSEGGIASAFTSSLASEYAPELALVGTAVVTPPVDNKTLVFELGQLTNLSELAGMGALMFSGARVSDPQLDAAFAAGDLLSAKGYERWSDIESKCLAQLTERNAVGGLGMWSLWGPAARDWKQHFYAILDENDPRWVKLGPEPVRFYSGGMDLVAWSSYIRNAVNLQAAAGANITYKNYPWATHVTITDENQAAPDIEAFLASRLGR